MQSERDYLVREIFPELRERCAKRRLHLVDIDLRWGVTEEEAERGRVLEICLDEIERCRPFFIGMLGERYGSVLPQASAPDDPAYDWLRELQHKHSVTALEIYHGVLHNQQSHTRSFFYFRDPSFLSGVPVELRDAFLPESEEASLKLTALKNEIRSQCPLFDNYPCNYAGVADGRAMLGGLEAFGQRVLSDLWSAISEEYPEQDAQPDELETERAFHEAFIEARIQRFIGRGDLLDQMKQYADGDSVSPLIVAGAAGGGKSALLAKFAHDYAAANPSSFVLSHFIGASPGSTDIRSTLLRLCGEINHRLGIDARAPEDFQELWQEFLKALERAGSAGRFLLVIDALNQLDDRHDPQSLHWLPSRLPPGVRIIVSALEGDFLKSLRRLRPPPAEIEVATLADNERRALVRQTLWDYRKRLDERPDNDQMGRLLSKAEATNPLYLVIACEELRVFGEFERVTARIDALPDDTERLLEQVLERLERDLGGELIREALSLIECSRQGLLEVEILELLRRDDEAQLPRALWARLYRGLRFYLRPAGEAGEGLLDFFHRQLAKAVRKRYLSAGNEQQVHRKLARFFRSKIDPRGERAWLRDYPRGLTELPAHLLRAGMHAELFDLARDNNFIKTVAEVFPQDPQLPLEALQHALDAAAHLDDAALMAEFVLAHALRRARVAGESPLDTLRQGDLERAWELADLHSAESCALWHLVLAWDLKERGRSDEARATLQRLSQRDLPRMRHSYWVSRCAVQLLARIAAVDQPLFHSLEQRLLEDGERGELCYATAAAGSTEEARTVAGSLTVNYRRDEAFRNIGKAQAEIATRHAHHGDIAIAIDLTRDIADDVGRSTAFREIAGAQAAAGFDAEAKTTFAMAVELAMRDAGLLKEIALAQTRAGYRDEAREVFRIASDLSRQSIDGYFGDEIAAGVASAIAETGDLDLALALARDIKSSRHQGAALCAIAEAQIRLRDRDSAIATARSIRQPESMMKSLNVIASTLAAQGQAAASREVFSKALDVAMTVRDSRDGANGLREVALAQMRSGFIEEGRQTFERAFETIEPGGISDRDATQLRYLAENQAAAGDFDAAVRTASEVADEIGESDRMQALSAVASAGGAAGNTVRAKQMLDDLVTQIKSISVPAVDSFGAIARAYVKLGEFKDACELIQISKARGWTAAESIVFAVFGYPVSFNEPKSQSITDTARARAILGDMLQATMKSETTDNEGRATALRDLVKDQIEIGELDRAIEIAKKIPPGYYSDNAYEIAAKALARAGQFERAAEIANQIPDQRHRKYAREAMAEALAGNRRFDDALAIAQEFEGWEREGANRRIGFAMAEIGEYESAIQLTTDERGKEDMHVLLRCAGAQMAAGDLAAARESFIRAGSAANPERGSDEFSDGYYGDLNLCQVVDQQAKAGFADDARNTLLLAREAGLRCMIAAQSRTDHERGLGAESLKWVGERQANLGLIDDAFETLELMRTRQMLWHRAVQRTKEGKVLQSISAAQSDAGQFNDAHRTAGEIEPQDVHVDALKHLAIAESRSGLRDEAKRHLAEAIQIALEGIKES